MSLHIPQRPSEPGGLPVEPGVAWSELRDFQKLVLAHVGEMLPRIAGWPPDFYFVNPSILAQSNMLLQRGCAERPTTADRAID